LIEKAEWREREGDRKESLFLKVLEIEIFVGNVQHQCLAVQVDLVLSGCHSLGNSLSSTDLSQLQVAGILGDGLT